MHGSKMGEARPFQGTGVMDASEEAWYAVKVHTRSEPVALASLHYQGLESYCPHALVRKKYCDRMKTIPEPIFPGYVFCRFALSRKAKVLSGNAIEYIVGCGGRPASIPVSEIEAVRLGVAAGGQTAAIPRCGERVRIIAGSLAGVEGILVREANRNQFVVSVALLQRGLSVTVDQCIVEEIQK
jgi:transcription antitermination factor NusG